MIRGVQLKLQGDNLLIRQAPLITAVVTPDLTLEMYPFNKKLSLSGTVDVPRALISMPEASEPVVGLSSDVRVVREGDDQLAISEVGTSLGYPGRCRCFFRESGEFPGL